jgi:pimeloyl-ACP methyl ester carboxylesterase
MAEENLAEYDAAKAGPEAYAAYLEVEFMPVLEATPDQLREAMGGLVTPVDQDAMTGDLLDWMARTFQRAGAQGVVGVRDDGLAATRPWGFDLAAITVPVAVWQGRQDAMVPYAHGEWLASHVPGAQAHLFEDEGHISLAARIEDVLADLVRLGGI